MCCEGKCFGCIRVETGSLVFGVISSVLWALVNITCVIGFVVVNVFYDRIWNFWEYPNFQLINTILGSVLAVGLLNFFFCVLLCDGINKRNTTHIKAYFIYGVTTTVLSSIAVVIVVAVSSMVLIPLVIPIIIYSLILHMIKMTMEQFTGGVVYAYNHRLLVESQAIHMA